MYFYKKYEITYFFKFKKHFAVSPKPKARLTLLQVFASVGQCVNHIGFCFQNHLQPKCTALLQTCVGGNYHQSGTLETVLVSASLCRLRLRSSENSNKPVLLHRSKEATDTVNFLCAIALHINSHFPNCTFCNWLLPPSAALLKGYRRTCTPLLQPTHPSGHLTPGDHSRPYTSIQ